jgi:hypothetical protein
MKELYEDQVDEKKSLPVLVDYEPAAQYLADEGRNIFTGPMNGGLWNARCMDACITSKKQGDKAAYELLLNFGDRLILGLSAGEKLKWQEIKDKAAQTLKCSRKQKANTASQSDPKA